jgi:hypothetical protein
LKEVYGSAKKINGMMVVPPSLNVHHLDLQALLFKLTMKNNVKSTMKPLLDLNLVTKLWQNLTSFQCLIMKNFKYFKVAKIVATQVIGLVENENVFQHLLS